MTCAQGLLRLLWGGARSWSATGLTRSDNKNTRDEKNNEQKEEGTAKLFSYEKKENQRTLIAQSASLERVAMRAIPVLLENGKQKLRVKALLDDCSTKIYLNADAAVELGLEGDVLCMSVSVFDGENKQF